MSELDTVQRMAVESGAKTIVVTGGPGTGKTHLLTRRFAHMIQSRDVPLSSILVFTFSSASAATLRRCLEGILQQSYDELWIHTFHSFANSVLAEYAASHDTSQPPILVTPFREYLAIKQSLRAEQPRLRSRLRPIALKDGLAREMSDFFGLLRQHLLSPADFASMASALCAEIGDLSRMYSVHDSYMRNRNWVGVRDAVARVLELFGADPEFLGQYRRKFSHILVDEFQEINPAQLRLLTRICSRDASLFVTGDEDQQIYRFRGGAVGQFSDIADGREDVERFTLEENHRLPAAIRKASQNLIGHNHGAAAKPAPVTPDGELGVTSYKDAVEQAYGVARDIKCKVLDSSVSPSPISYSDFAVLCRSTARSALPFEQAFSYYKIPYVLYHCTSFYQDAMVRCTADFLRLLVNPEDDRALFRVLCAPAFHIDVVELRRLATHTAAAGGMSLYEAIRRIARRDAAAKEPGIKDEGAVRTLEAFVSWFEHMREQAIHTDCASALVHSIMSTLFFRQILDNEDAAAGVRDAQNLRLLYEVVADVEAVFQGTANGCALSDLVEYLDHAFAHFSSQQENDPADEPADGVRIMTVHQAKGMEFPFVYLIDMTDADFPLFSRSTCLLTGTSLDELSEAVRRRTETGNPPVRNLQFAMSPQEQLREERHLAYVAITRATRRLDICFTAELHLLEPVRPSPFLEELLGAPIEPDAGGEDASDDASDPQSLLASCLNKQEIESALRSCARRLSPNMQAVDELYPLFEALGLDAHFICSESPFEGEPRRIPDLADHTYSATQLATYLACPRRFFFEKILKIAPERPEDFGLGQLIHRVLEEFHKEVKRFSGAREALEEILRGAFRAVWAGSIKEGKDSGGDAFCNHFPTALQRAAIARRAEEILQRYIRTETTQASNREIVACERFIDFSVRTYRFTARIDRIDAASDGHHIIDHKTSAGGPKGAKAMKKLFLNLDSTSDYVPADFQLPLYLLACRSAGYDPSQLSYYWLAQQDASGMFKKASLRVCEHEPDCLSLREMQTVEDSIVAVVELIAGGFFDPDPKSSFECSWCSFDFVCSTEGEETGEDG